MCGACDKLTLALIPAVRLSAMYILWLCDPKGIYNYNFMPANRSTNEFACLIESRFECRLIIVVFLKKHNTNRMTI